MALSENTSYILKLAALWVSALLIIGLERYTAPTQKVITTKVECVGVNHD